jgi:biotin carboxylase
MKRVLIFSHTTGYQLRAFNDAAEALGIELVFATDRCHRLEDPWQDRAVAVRFFDEAPSVAALVRRAGAMPVHGVIAVGDRPVPLAARAAEALGLRWHSVEGAAASVDKRRLREILAAAGLPSPRFRVLEAGSPIRDSGSPMRDSGSPIRDPGFTIRDSGSGISDQGFPCVLKPLGLSGSRGVIRADDPAEFSAAFERIRALLARPQVRTARSGLEDQILVEDYIEGREFAVEGVLTDGNLQVFAIFDKPDPLEGPFFEETIYVTPSGLPATVQRQVAETVQAAASSLGLGHGPIHAECRITGDGIIYILEVAARPIGGLCSRVVTFRDGESLETVLLRHALGGDVGDCVREDRAAAVMMIPIPARGMFKGVQGEEQARAVPGVTEIHITAKHGQLLEPLPEAGSYLGFIFARANTPSGADAAVRTAHGRLEFVLSKDLAVRP